MLEIRIRCSGWWWCCRQVDGMVIVFAHDWIRLMMLYDVNSVVAEFMVRCTWLDAVDDSWILLSQIRWVEANMRVINPSACISGVPPLFSRQPLCGLFVEPQLRYNFNLNLNHDLTRWTGGAAPSWPQKQQQHRCRYSSVLLLRVPVRWLVIGNGSCSCSRMLLDPPPVGVGTRHI